MKRAREEEENNGLDVAKCLMLLARGLPVQPIRQYRPPPTTDVFECKTCNRRFSSFQALGGHRASHKKPRLMSDDHHESAKLGPTKSLAPKKHECGICGQVFTTGQALGGHMRRHRAVMEMQGFADVLPHHHDAVVSKSPIVLKRSNSSVKVSSWLDLNLTPLENDLRLLFGKIAPKVDPFI